MVSDRDAEYVSFIEDFKLLGRRYFTPSELEFLNRYQRILRTSRWWSMFFAGAGSLALASSLMLVLATPFYEVAVGLMGFGLMGAVMGFAKLQSIGRRLDSIDRELDFGRIDAYGLPPEWVRTNGEDAFLEVILHSPVTRRMLWMKGTFYEHEYVTPSKVVKPPESYHALVESGWLEQGLELHRDLSPAEVEELQGHSSRRYRQILLGYVSIIILVIAVYFSYHTRTFSLALIVVMSFCCAAIPRAWNARWQKRALDIELRHGRVMIFQDKHMESNLTTFEYLEATMIMWSSNGLPAPWRGRTGA